MAGDRMNRCEVALVVIVTSHDVVDLVGTLPPTDVANTVVTIKNDLAKRGPIAGQTLSTG